MVYEERGGRSTEYGYGFAGYTVYDTHYEKIGEVDDVFVDESDRPKYIGLKMGLLGTRTTLVPMSLVRVNDRRRIIEVAADKDAVEGGPVFGDDREITSEFERRVLGYYRAKTSQPFTERESYGAYSSGAAVNERGDLRPGERVGTRERETGSVDVRKQARTDRERDRVERHEETHVEPARAEGRRRPEAAIEDNEVRVPVVEEEIVVKKRPVVKEEIRIRKEVVEDEEVIEEDVRKEEVEVDDQTVQPRALRRIRNTDDEMARYLPRGTRDGTSLEEGRKQDRDTHREEEASQKGQQHAGDTEAIKKAQRDLPIGGYDDLRRRGQKEPRRALGGRAKGDPVLREEAQEPQDPSRADRPQDQGRLLALPRPVPRATYDRFEHNPETFSGALALPTPLVGSHRRLERRRQSTGGKVTKEMRGRRT